MNLKNIPNYAKEILYNYLIPLNPRVPVESLLLTLNIECSKLVCFNRVKIRGRDGENIPLEYLQKCHDYHENWINNINLPVKILDGNIEFINEIPEEWRNNIIHFIAHFISSQNVQIPVDGHYC